MLRPFNYNGFTDFITLSTLKLIIVLRIVYCACSCVLGVLCLVAFSYTSSTNREGPGILVCLLRQLADVLGAEVGASRAAVDAGWIDHDRQIGQTGVTVRPKLYIACGISGQIQHIAGMQESSIIISVNSDPDAPINTIADYVITGNVEDVVPKLIKYYKKNSK